MFKKTLIVALGALVMGTGSAQASDARIYAYSTSENFCPSGLQPISINGVICCGTPNQSISYQQAKAHAVVSKKRVRRVSHVKKSSRIVCPVGEKGCYRN
jgi:hypothetical protein